MSIKLKTGHHFVRYINTGFQFSIPQVLRFFRYHPEQDVYEFIQEDRQSTYLTLPEVNALISTTAFIKPENQLHTIHELQTNRHYLKLNRSSKVTTIQFLRIESALTDIIFLNYMGEEFPLRSTAIKFLYHAS